MITNNKNIAYSHFCYAMQLKQPQNLHNMQYINASTKLTSVIYNVNVYS